MKGLYTILIVSLLSPSILYIVDIHANKHENKIFKVFIMTRNEWPAIISNILYHGYIFGFSNVHVIDGSTDPFVIQSLKKMAHHLNVQLHFTDADLNALSGVMSSIMREEKKYCDFLTKIDTDELIALYDDTSKELVVDKTAFLDSINSISYTRDKHQFSYNAFNRVASDCNHEDDILRSTSTFQTVVGPIDAFKSFYPSDCFKNVDLGGHSGELNPDCNDVKYVQTNLSIYHYHHLCLPNYAKELKQVNELH